MGVKNFLIEGVSCTGKTSVCHALRQRGYQAINGDQELAYCGDPETGKTLKPPLDFVETTTAEWFHNHHIWDLGKVRSLVADKEETITFFCGGSRNFPHFIDLFDCVFVLVIDRVTLEQRLRERPKDEFGSNPQERDLILRLHSTQQDIPQDCIEIDATNPLDDVVEAILTRCG